MPEQVTDILFVQNLLERGVTAVEAFKPDKNVSRMHVVQELDAIRFLRRIEEFANLPTPGLIVLDIEIPKPIRKKIRKELKRQGRKDIPVVYLDYDVHQ